MKCGTAVLLLALSAGPAQAEICSQRDLSGQWVLFAGADSSAPHDCVITFDPYGLLYTIKSYCNVGNGFKTQARSGAFKVLENCRVKGTIRFVNFGDVRPAFPIQGGQLVQNKTMIIGVSVPEPGFDPTVFTMAKVPQ
jgi:hypothetical protein